MATYTTTRKRTARLSQLDIIKIKAVWWAVGLISYPVGQLVINGWMATH